MDIDPRYEKALNHALGEMGLSLEDLQYLKFDEFRTRPRVGRKLQEYTLHKLEDRGLSFGMHTLSFLKNHIDELRNLPASVTIHNNDWGAYREETIILEGGAAICGLSFPGQGEPEEHRDRAWLHDLSVLPGQRSKGLATRLLEICRRRAKAAGRRRLSLWVKPDTWQEDWYRRLGFLKDHEMMRTDGSPIYDLELTEPEADRTYQKT